VTRHQSMISKTPVRIRANDQIQFRLI